MSDDNAHDNTYNGSSSEAKMDWPKTLCFKISKKPSQKHKIRVQASLTLPLSLSLRPAFKVCKRFGPRRLLIRWVYSHTSREDFQSMYTYLLGVSFKIEMNLKMSTDIDYLSHATKAQTSLRKCAFSIQRDTHPSQHTKSGYHRWQAGVALWIKLGSRCQASLVIC